MPLDLSSAFRLVIDTVTNRQVVDIDHARSQMTEIEQAINALSGTVTFDSSTGSFATKTAAQAATGIADKEFIWLAGQNAPVDAPPLIYKREDSPAINDGASFLADGKHWHIVESNAVTERHFGAVGDGVADDTDAFQNWIDFANHKDKTNVARNLPLEPISSRIRITKPIWYSRSIGGGVQTPNSLISQSIRGRDEDARAGTVIIKDFEGAMALIIHGGRDVIIRGLAFDNPNYAVRTFMNFDRRRIKDPTVWDQLRVASRTADECYIVIDPFFGTAPTDAYVAGTNPGEIPLADWFDQTLYNTHLQTSGVTIDGCYFENCPGPAVLGQPNLEANADFVDVINCHIDGCRYLYSTATSQGRGSNISNNKGDTFLDLVTTVAHGADGAQGRINGAVEHNSCALGRRLLTIQDTAVGSALTEVGPNYMESGMEYVAIEGGGAGETMIRLTDNTLNVDPKVHVSGGVNGQPGYVVKGNTQARVEIDGWAYSATTYAVQTFQPRFTRITNGVASPEVLINAAQSEHEWLRMFMSACLGFYFNVGNGQGLGPHDVKALQFDESTDAPVSSFGWANTFDNLRATRKHLLPLWQWEYMFANERYGQVMQKRMMTPRSYLVTQATSPASSAVRVTLGTDRVDTFLFGNALADAFFAENRGGANSDGIWDPETGTVWGIFSRGTPSGTAPNRTIEIKAYRMNNYEETALGVFGDYETLQFNGADLTQVQGAWAAFTVYAAGDTVQSSTDGRWYQTAAGGTSGGDDGDLDGGSDTGITDWTQVQSSGSLFLVNHRMFATDRLFLCDTVSGSADVTVYSPRRSASDITALENEFTGVQVGDRLFDHDTQDAVFLNDSNRITAITDNADGTATVTMAGNAARSITGHPFHQFIRQPPANVATPNP